MGVDGKDHGGSGDPAGGRHDPALLGLELIARHHHVPVDAESLRHAYGPPARGPGRPGLFGFRETLRAARSLRFRAREVRLREGDVDNAFLPALCRGRKGAYFLLEEKIAPQPGPAPAGSPPASGEEAKEAAYRVRSLGEAQESRTLTAKALFMAWDGDAVLMSPRGPSLLDKAREFNLKWFVPALIKYRRMFRDVMAASFAFHVVGLAAPLYFQLVMDKVLVHKAMDTLDVLSVAFMAAVFFEVSLNAFRDVLLSHTTSRVDVELRGRLVEHLLSLELGWFKKRTVGRIVAFIREMDSFLSFVTSTALTLPIDLCFTFVYIAVMQLYSGFLTLVVTASFPLYAALSAFVTPSIRDRLDMKFRLGAAVQSFLVEMTGGIETIKSLAVEPLKLRQWKDLLAGFVTAAYRAGRLGLLAFHAASLLQKSLVIMIIWLGAREVMAGEMTVGQLVAFNMMAARVSGPVLKLVRMWQEFQQARVSLRCLGEILDAPSEKGLGKGMSGMKGLTGAFRLERVRFRYGDGLPPVIDGLSLEIRPGEVVGLTGPSGCGKSTLAMLVQKLYVPESGRILADGIDLSQINEPWLRRQTGVVLQDSALFSGTVRENIAMADPGASSEQVVRAAVLAGAHDFITGLPEGYETQVGERGGSLSGGQRQRIAIARVLVGDPRVLIFDEATSALDNEAERAVADGMGRICRGRTVLIIAHRLSIMSAATRIVVLDKRGRIEEDGPPGELMKRKGAFYRMVCDQIRNTAFAGWPDDPQGP